MMSLGLILAFLAALAPVGKEKVEFSASSEPSFGDIRVESRVKELRIKDLRPTKVWQIELRAHNTGDSPRSFKLVLSAEPHIVASRYLVPGVLYNGNEFVGRNILSDGRAFSLEMPSGWSKDGQPWIFAPDRSSIPGCSISENADKAFGLFASDADHNSIGGSSSLEKLDDGTFRHKIYWPSTEAPVSYTDKRKFTSRYDEYITLLPGDTYEVTAYACEGRPKWENYGFTVVFPVAWKLLEHNTPAQRTIEETVDLDLDFMKWTRRRNNEGSWFSGGQNDMMFTMGYMNWAKSPDGYTLADYEKDFTLNRWDNNAVEESKKLKEGEYLWGAGAKDIGFASQTFQRARLTVEYGLDSRNASDVEFGLEVLNSWIDVRQQSSGLFRRGTPPRPGRTFTDASEVGWSISELSRTSAFLTAHRSELEAIGVKDVEATASKFKESASRVVEAVIKVLPGNGALGSKWDFASGELLSYAGDCGGYVLMGLVRYWLLNPDPRVKDVIDKAFDYYYSRDINRYECNGGAMDCSSVDREGIQPFLSAAVEMWKADGSERYLEMARKAGWYFLSWVYLQNPVYEPDLDLSRYNWRPAGSTIVGTEHSAVDDYGNLLISELMTLARADGNPMWREVAALMWRNGTQGFADEDRKIWHAMERPRGSKNEAWFPTRWSKYRTGERKRGSLNDHLMTWGGTYRLASLRELSDDDRAYLASVSVPATQLVLENAHGRALVDLRGANLRVWKHKSFPDRQILGSVGIPVYWPWGVYEGKPGCRIHGLTPYYDWKLVSKDDSSLVLALDDNESTRRTWPYRFHAEMEYHLGNTLKVEFRVTNTDRHSYSCTDLLHPYFYVSHPTNCSISGLDGSTYYWKKEAEMGGDRIWNGDFPVAGISGGNPGIVFDKGDGTYVLKDGDRQVSVRFEGGIKFVAFVSNEGAVAMETGTIYKDRAYTLKPGETHILRAEIEIIK